MTAESSSLKSSRRVFPAALAFAVLNIIDGGDIRASVGVTIEKRLSDTESFIIVRLAQTLL